ncbi:MAG: class I SAM-dependent RNA methyltransferase [Mogibacterium sp.]|nr:class I SAM-dependent RNA methyltransferase [Mogibacterium sp.]
MEKGQICELRIEDMSSEGSGIGRCDGFVVFVPGTVPGDVVKAELTKVKKRYAFGSPVEIVEASPDRITEEEPCPYSDRCGGCPYIEIRYDAQLAIKEKQVREKLERMGEVSFCEGSGDESAGARFNPIIPAEGIYGYRNKAAMPISTGGLMTAKGGIQHPVHEPRIGFRPAKSHEVTDCTTCLLQTDAAMAAAEATRRFMEEDHICSYDKRWDKGLFHGMTVRTAFGTGEVMVVYDINGKGIPNAAKLIEYLDEAIYEAGLYDAGDSYFSLESVVIRNGKKTETLAGKSTITDIVEVGGRQLQFEISADSFYQVNHAQMQNLYSLVRGYCEQVAQEGTAADAGGVCDTECSGACGTGRRPVILDLYCGIGTIGLCVADIAEHVHGIEIVKQATLDANRNATINGIVNATYRCGKAEEILGDEEAVKELHPDIAILDPPRAGCKENLLTAIAGAGIRNIIYVSCDPATLARDIKLLRGHGYELVEATPVDLFPNTLHVECVVLMSKKA